MSEIVSRLLALAPGSRRRVAGLTAQSLWITATYLVQGILIARVLGEVFGGGRVAAALPLLAGVVVLQVTRAFAVVRREAKALEVSGMIKEEVRDRLTRKLFELGPGTLQRTRAGNVQSTTIDGVEHLDPLIGRFLPQTIASILGAVAVTAYVVVLDPLVGVIILVCGLAVPLSSWGSGRFLKKDLDAWDVTYRRLYAENLEAMQGMATLKAFNASHRRSGELAGRAEDFLRDTYRVMVTALRARFPGELAVPIGSAAAVGISALHAAGGALNTVELFTILLLSRECFRPLNHLMEAYHSTYYALPASRRIFELLDTQPVIAEPSADAVPASPDGLAVPPGLEFVDVTFTYDERNERALDDFSLRIAPGERVAVVGRSGAGKTTIVSLLLRFFEPDAGTILVGGRDARELPLADLRALIGVVAQDTYLFYGSVRDNLLLARADASDGELEDAARAARAHEFVSALPQGYDTVIGERGLKLSGGERQRIAIARALLRDAPILVLDEPTSSVDAANEAEIQHALDELTRGRTTLVIAHRLSTVRDADRIVVLDAGQVLEAGDHGHLIARDGAYARLVAAQIGAVG